MLRILVLQEDYFQLHLISTQNLNTNKSILGRVYYRTTLWSHVCEETNKPRLCIETTPTKTNTQINTCLVMAAVNVRSSSMWNMRSPPLTYSMTRKRCSLVWKLEWKPVRKGGFFCSDKTCRSLSTPSTSSSFTMRSFFMLFMAYTSFVALCSARKTCCSY